MKCPEHGDCIGERCVVCDGRRGSGRCWANESALVRGRKQAETPANEDDGLDWTPVTYAPEIERAWRGTA